MGLSVVLWVITHAQPAEAAALAATDPDDLTVEAAAEHIRVAREVSIVTSTDPAVLLAIAWHESRYVVNNITKEPGRRVSCGVMTPVPKKRCGLDELTIDGGYLAGAVHYAEWLGRCRENVACADLAYAGGMGLVRACARGRRLKACAVHSQFERRAAMIRRTLLKARDVQEVPRP